MNAFEKLKSEMPMRLVDGFDPLTHTTLSDLVWIAIHEIDLHEEGDDEMGEDDEIQVRAFLKKAKRAKAASDAETNAKAGR